MVSDELRQWEFVLFLGEKARNQIHSQPLEYYTDLLRSIREKSIIGLRKKNEDWLYEENAWDNGVTHNNY
ncbi:hypothetical protein [Bacillus coahuilensis]|uniref:hypothetical protein n=1 Tax=Bacillus coahuilensis TaxID=408580 RepID=UPI0001851050|nr:hypothetical protein [Bacillus coahuilensis]